MFKVILHLISMFSGYALLLFFIAFIYFMILDRQPTNFEVTVIIS